MDRKLSAFLNYAVLAVFAAGNILLLFPYEHSWNKLVMIAMCCLCCLVCYSWSKVLWRIYVWLLVMQFTILYPVMAVYGKINTDFLLSFYYSNFKESISYLGLVPLYVWLMVALNIGLAVFLSRKQYRLFASGTKPGRVLLTVLFLLASSGLSLRMLLLTNFEFTREGNYSYLSYLPLSKTGLDLYSKFYNVALYQQNRDSLSGALRLSRYDFDSVCNSKEVYMIVVGESVTKNYMSAYGYTETDNTPFISGSANIQFDHYITPAAHTIGALMEILGFKDHTDQPGSVFALLHSLPAFRSIWVSAQERVGWKDNPVSIIASLADTQVFLPDTRLNLASDREAFELLQQINKQQKYKVVFLHLYGSHPNACDRTGGKYRTFVKHQDLSCYLESIRQTDQLLADIHSYLEDNYSSYKLMFFSDHGLAAEGGRMVHGYQPAAYQAPLNIWDDTCTVKTRISAPRSGFDFKFLWTEFFGCYTPQLKAGYRFISSEPVPHEIYIYDENSRKVVWKP